jgi:hypothetical protein
LIASAHDSDLQRAAVAAAFAIAPLGGEIQSSTLSQPVNTPSALLASGITTAAPAVAATAAALHWLVDCRRRLGVALQHANMDLRGAQHQFDRRLRLLLDMHGVIHGASLGNEHSTGASQVSLVIVCLLKFLLLNEYVFQAMRHAAHDLTSTAYSSSDPNVVSTAVALTALPEQTPEVALAHEGISLLVYLFYSRFLIIPYVPFVLSQLWHAVRRLAVIGVALVRILKPAFKFDRAASANSILLWQRRTTSWRPCYCQPRPRTDCVLSSAAARPRYPSRPRTLKFASRPPPSP